MKIISIILFYFLFSSFASAQKMATFPGKVDSLSLNHLVIIKNMISTADLDTVESIHRNLYYFRQKSVNVIPIPPVTTENSRLELFPLYFNDRVFEFLTLLKDSISSK